MLRLLPSALCSTGCVQSCCSAFDPAELHSSSRQSQFPMLAPADAARQVPLPCTLCGPPCAVVACMHVSWARIAVERWQAPSI